MANETLYIIDALSQIFKAYHAVRPMSYNGRSTNATYGFCQILGKLRRCEKPTHMVVAFDLPGPSFRHAVYSLYKANRPEAPADLPEQIHDVRRILEAMNIPTVSVENYEADDLVATVARRAAAVGMDVRIVSSDKDLMQLVNERISLIHVEKNTDPKLVGSKEVMDKWGVRPDQIVDLLSLMGDTSDNVPGVSGVGPKTAAALLETYGTLNAVFEAVPTMKGRQKEKLAAGEDNARLARSLVRLEDQVPIVIPADFYRLPEENTVALREIYKELGFRKLLDDLNVENPPTSSNRLLEGKVPEYRTVHKVEDLLAFRDKAREAGVVSFDVETDTRYDTPHPIFDRLVGISMSCRVGEAIYIPVDVPKNEDDDSLTDLFADWHEELVEPPLSLEQVLPVVDEILRERSILKIGHNIKYDLHVLTRYLELEDAYFDMEGSMADTMLMAYLLNPDRKLGLKQLVLDELGIPMMTYMAVTRKGDRKLKFSEVPLEEAAPYACADADYTLQLWFCLENKLRKDERLWKLFGEMEMPLIGVLMRMERDGARVDPKHFSNLGGEFAVEMDALKSAMWKTTGTHFNPASPVQVGDVLFDRLHLRRVRDNSTDEAVLQVLKKETSHPLIDMLLRYRQLDKLNGTYVRPLLDYAKDDPFKKNSVHTMFRQAAVSTGRLSSSDPNLQNIPVRTREGLRIREGFIPVNGKHVLISADYSQIELRVLAHLSQDPALVRAFRNGEDVHALTASAVYGVALEDVTKEMRNHAKVVNFGIIYGKTAYTLADDLGISTGEAAKFIDNYFQMYAGVRAWIDRTVADAERDGFVMTMMGRRRYVPNIHASNQRLREAARRVAMNAPIQGTAADMMKMAMLSVDHWLTGSELCSRVILQVHDELILDVPKTESEFVSARVADLMSGAVPLSVPLVVDVAIGNTWADCM